MTNDFDDDNDDCDDDDGEEDDDKRNDNEDKSIMRAMSMTGEMGQQKLEGMNWHDH